MIEYTYHDLPPPLMYALKRDRVRRGEGLRKIENAGAWVFNQDSEIPWAVRVGKTYFTLQELYLDEADAERALLRLVAKEYQRERDSYRKKVERLQANLPHMLIGMI
jgi:hypothetical protein